MPAPSSMTEGITRHGYAPINGLCRRWSSPACLHLTLRLIDGQPVRTALAGAGGLPQGACTGFARPGTARSIACDDRAPPRHCYTARMHPRHEVLPRPCAGAAGAQLRPREEGQQARRTSARSSMPSTPLCWPIRDQADVLGRREGAWTGFMGAHPVLLRNAGFAPEYERHECQIHKITTAVVTVPYYAIPVAFTAPCALQPRQSSH